MPVAYRTIFEIGKLFFAREIVTISINPPKQKETYYFIGWQGKNYYKELLRF